MSDSCREIDQEKSNYKFISNSCIHVIIITINKAFTSLKNLSLELKTKKRHILEKILIYLQLSTKSEISHIGGNNEKH